MVLLFAAVLALATPALAQSDVNPSGLPLPRFASTRSEPINVRVGPGTRYDIAWVYVKSGQPVEIVQEFDTWRKIRDYEGDEGWVHQNLLSGRRAALVTPWSATGQVGLREQPESESAVRAWLGAHFLVEIGKCDGRWCFARAGIGTDNGARAYSGYLPQSDLWGVYPGEIFK